MKRKSLALLTAVLWTVLLSAQPYCDVRTFTIRDGLAANIISGFAQTADGLMWFPTWNGLCLYDGYHFTTFRNAPGQDMALSTNRILFVKPSVTGNIWCCTSSRHVYLFDTRRSRFVDVGRIIAEQYGRPITVRNLYPLDNGYTWLMGKDGEPNYRVADSLVMQGGGIEQYSVEAGNLSDNVLKKAELASDGGEWIFSLGGVRLVGTDFFFDVQMEHRVELGDVTLFAAEDGRVFAFYPASRAMRAVDMPDGVCRLSDAVALTASKAIFATNRGVVAVDGRTLRATLLSVQTPSQPSEEATSLFVDSRHRVWAFTPSQGVVVLDSAGMSPQWLMARAANPLHSTTSEKPFIHEDKYGTVWAVPAGGTFSYYDESTGSLVPFVIRSQRADRYQPQIDKSFFDAQGNLWFTGTHDLSLVEFGYRHFKQTLVYPGQEVRALLIDRHGRTWAGTNRGLLAVFDTDRRLLGYVDRQGRLQQRRTEFASKVYSLYEDSIGRVWVGTKGDGLFVISGEGRVERYASNPSDPYSISCDDIYDITTDARGRIWVASYGGGPNLVDASAGRMRFINHRNALAHYPLDVFGKVRRITSVPEGVVVLSTTDGIVTFADGFTKPGDIRFHTTTQLYADTASLMAPDVLQTIVTRSGHVLVTTLGGGVQMAEPGTLLRDSLRFHALPGDNPVEGIVQSLAEDSRGNLWIVRENSIDQYNFDTGKMLQYGPGNIGDGVEICEAKPVHDPHSDCITVGTRGGFVSFNPSDLRKSEYCPNIVFTQVLHHGNNERQPILNCDVLDVPADRRNLTIFFAAIEYSYKDLVQYAYRLEGIDDGWNYVGSANSASFNRLPAGRYRLLVKSTNSDGVWVDNVAALNIYAHPTFWETPWAWALYALLTCGVIYVAILIYRLRARARLERDLNNMKTQFFTEISHKLRTPLTLIGGPVTEILRQGGVSEAARQHLEMVQRNASRMLVLVNKMLKYGREHNVYISDDNASEHLPDSSVAVANDTPQTVPQPGMDAIRLLIVEDNDDLRAFLVSILGAEYSLLQAENGQRGLEIAEAQLPDFIITDVMMPVMDGLTMVRRLKQNKDTCHIPIIVLSAKASLDDRLQGLREGIDDYITKPFSATYLKARVANIIGQRRALQQNYVGQLRAEDKATYRLQSPQIVDADNEMMKRLLSFIEEHIGDADLKIEDLAEAVNLGRSVFYGKIKSIVGMSPVSFLHYLRIQRAEELIKKSNYPISQIAYSVGFSDPKYFGRCFKKETGMTPSEYRDNALRNGGEKEEA